MANLGNAWHIPGGPEPEGSAGMRDPVGGVFAGSTVTVFSGNQFRGHGNPGNQLQAGSKLLFRAANDTAWRELPLTFRQASGNNKYFAATIPAGTFADGSAVQYYLRIAYDDRDTTFLHAGGTGSAATADEGAARAAPFGFPVGPSGEFLSVDSGVLQARVYRGTGHIELSGPDLGGAPQVVSFAAMAVRASGRTDVIGRVLSSSTSPTGLELTQDLGGTPVHARLGFPRDGVMRYEVIDWAGVAPSQTAVAAQSGDEEHFYGFGEKFNSFDQAGKVVRIMTSDHPGDKGDHSYKVMPWFVSTRGYGFHLDSTAESLFDMRRKGGFAVANLSPSLAFDVVYGPRLTDVLSRFTARVGRPPLPPPWAFGPWISTDVWRNGGEVRYAVTRHQERGIPASVFVFDSPWEVSYNDFKFNAEQFGTVEKFRDEDGVEHDGFDMSGGIGELMTFLQRNGLKAVCWMVPFINTSSTRADRDDHGVRGQNFGQSPNYQSGSDGGFFVRASKNGPPLKVRWWKGEGSPVDFTDPAARDWLANQLRALLDSSSVTTRTGREPAIGGFKTDDGESRSSDGNVYIPENATYADGRTGREMRNAYCIEYHGAVYRALRAAVGDDGLIFARSGFTGTQAFPGCWAGDNAPNFGDENGMPGVIVAGLSAAMSGYSIWGHDVGGYLNGNFSAVSRANLFMRWAQFGCFSPILQMHRQVKKRQGDPDAAALGQYPWGYGREAEENYRFYAVLHTRLFPYIYSYAKEANEKGLPIIRPLVLLDQDDPETHGVEHTYRFGNEFLVAPVIRPTPAGEATEREFYLPRGTWRDYWTGEGHAGGSEVRWRSADQKRFPLFVRTGAIVPMLLDDARTLCGADYVNDPTVRTAGDGLWLLIYPASANSAFTVYDGTEVRCESEGNDRAIVLQSIPRSVVLKVFTNQPDAVSLDGASLSLATVPAGFDSSNTNWDLPPALNSAAEGWAFASGFLFVKFRHVGGVVRVRF